MWRTIGIIAAMIVAGIVTFYVTLLSLGKPQSGDDILVNGRISIAAAVLAFLATGLIAWYLQRKIL